jgi:ELWxxDGT repeat protein
MVADLMPGAGSSRPRRGLELDGELFFFANDGEIWKSDGTAAGTVLIADPSPGADLSSPTAVANANGTLFFHTEGGPSGEGLGLWKSDGTTAGTTLLKTISVIGAIVPLPNGSVVFNGNDWNLHLGSELWVSDGTPEGTTLLVDIEPGSGSGYPKDLIAVGGIVYFEAYFWLTGGEPELWRTDGTVAGTYELAARPVDEPADVGGTLFFVSRDLVYGEELWKSDGITAGTVLVKDIVPGPLGSAPSDLRAIDGRLFFNACDEAGCEMWESDGTDAGTNRVADVNPGRGHSGALPSCAKAPSSTSQERART